VSSTSVSSSSSSLFIVIIASAQHRRCSPLFASPSTLSLPALVCPLSSLVPSTGAPFFVASSARVSVSFHHQFLGPAHCSASLASPSTHHPLDTFCRRCSAPAFKLRLHQFLGPAHCSSSLALPSAHHPLDTFCRRCSAPAFKLRLHSFVPREHLLFVIVGWFVSSLSVLR
jgi:ribosomal protein L37E